MVQYGSAKGLMGSPSPLRLARAEVWHQLELKNDTKYPWTHGPGAGDARAGAAGTGALTYTARGI